MTYDPTLGERRVRDEARERLLVQRRVAWTAAGAALLVLLLVARYADLQLLDYERYRLRAEQNRLRIVPVAPPRGLIRTRGGEVVADNRPAYRLDITPEKTPDMAATLDKLSHLLDLGVEDIETFNERRRAARRFAPVTLRYALSDWEVANVAVNRHRLPGVEITPYLQRFYPYGSLLAHVIGYVGRVDSAGLTTTERDVYRGLSHRGLTGVESQAEARLRGQTGRRRVEINAEGRTVDVLEEVPPIAGEDLQLTVDLELQRAAATALAGEPGAVVAIDIASGDVLALVSEPAYDPNLFVNGIARRDFARLLQAPDKPLFNRALQGAYEPGSTLKPFIALIALETGVTDPERQYLSTGEFVLPGSDRPYRDWRRGGHGWVNVEQALEQSVNTVFYQLALDLGIDRIAAELAPFGFGAKTGIDLPGEQAALLPTREWKQARFHQPWFPGETVILGIGQGYMLATPIQLATATARLAGNRPVQPHVIRAAGAPPADPESFDMAHQTVLDGMIRVMHGAQGTARQHAPSDYRMGGKTGTAQVFTQQLNRDYAVMELSRNLRHHALFIAFAPASAPQIAVAVVAEHGGAGSRAAAPIARRVLDTWQHQQRALTQRSGP